MQPSGNCKTIWVLFLFYWCIWILLFDGIWAKKQKRRLSYFYNWLYLCILYQWDFLYWRLKNGNFCGLLLWAPDNDWFQVWFLADRKKVAFLLRIKNFGLISLFPLLISSIRILSENTAVSFTFYSVLCSYTIR